MHMCSKSPIYKTTASVAISFVLPDELFMLMNVLKLHLIPETFALFLSGICCEYQRQRHREKCAFTRYCGTFRQNPSESLEWTYLHASRIYRLF